MRRHLLGITAIVLLLGALAFLIWPPQSEMAAGLQSACSRVGALSAVLWLAWHEVQRLPAWLLGVIPLLLAVLAFRPKWFLIAVPIVIALAVLSPRTPARK